MAVKFWQIRTTPKTPQTKQIIKAYAVSKGISIGEALDEIALKLAK